MAVFHSKLAGTVASTLLMLIIVSIIVFAATEVLPGNTATSILGQNATEENVAALQSVMGLDQPAVLRYIDWLAGAVRGDLGTSLTGSRPVSEVIGDALRNSLVLAAIAFLIGVPISLLLGVIAAVYRDRFPDTLISGVSGLLYAIPEFIVGSFLIVVFATWLHLVPAVTTLPADAPLDELLPGMWLPALTLAGGWLAYLVRALRSSLIDTLASPFARQARLAGIPARQIIMNHALRPAMPPVVATGALYLGSLLGGVVVVESVFNFPGLGTVIVDAVRDRDIPVIQAVALISAVGWALTHITAEFLIERLDPRTRRIGTA